MQREHLRQERLSSTISVSGDKHSSKSDLAIWRGLYRVDESRMNVEFIHPTQLSVEDIRAIAGGCLRIRFQKLDPQNMVRMALSEQLMFYKVWGNGFSGIVAVAPKDDTLWLELVVGKGLLKHFDEIHDWLISLARSHGMHSLTAIVASPVIYRLWLRRKAKEVARYFVEEISNGREAESSDADDSNGRYEQQHHWA